VTQTNAESMSVIACYRQLTDLNGDSIMVQDLRITLLWSNT